ncbi:DoxX family protein [Pendulispora albinea]|uniref:DoxX family protein n=1 Tax=Pendulispora albinea TaxID=2741071 RepID=A0ABZ2MAH5_9BACT
MQVSQRDSKSPPDRYASLGQPAQALLRFGIGTAFLSAVADRFGLYGPPGAPGVGWGDFAHFTEYTHTLTWWVPSALTPLLAWLATLGEIVFGVMLLVGLRTREAALGSAALLTSFALSMTFSARGIHSAFSYSVFSAAGGALLLATFRDPSWSLDALLQRTSRDHGPSHDDAHASAR